jgi:hypothetical protein
MTDESTRVEKRESRGLVSMIYVKGGDHLAIFTILIIDS